MSLQATIPLPDRATLLSTTANKKQFIRLLCLQDRGTRLHMIDEDQCKFGHEEADVNLIAYALHISDKCSCPTHIQVVSDDTDVCPPGLFLPQGVEG